jgi:hypothetical protein
MSAAECPELEELFSALAEGEGPALEHARGCDACTALLEEHRQLEKDLYRLADPLPPADFLHRVMAKVAAAPPTPVRTELKVGLSILAVTLAAAVATFVLNHGNIGTLGAGLASALVGAKSVTLGGGNLLSILWKTAAIPMAASLSLVLMLSLFFLRRLAGTHSLADAKVSP